MALRPAKKGVPMDKELVKTTIAIPRELWREARMRAAADDADFRTVVMRALEAYLRPAGAPKKGSQRR